MLSKSISTKEYSHYTGKRQKRFVLFTILKQRFKTVYQVGEGTQMFGTYIPLPLRLNLIYDEPNGKTEPGKMITQ
jgi:hypothetical protein